MKTIHLILNSHIDPVWLWPASAGVDVVLNTYRSACDILDENPDLVFTCGEAWTYWQVERTAPELFARIKALVERGQWHLVGGWWIQPDCNLPTEAGMRMQIDLGKQYFLKQFGHFPDAAYNIDSFGHTAHLPRLMRAAGQRHYIMMRPQEHEMKLPGRAFRWRTPGTDDEVITFRIAGGYSEFGRLELKHFERALADLPEGVNDTMCFIGVGDHGGGPTRKLIEFCRANVNAIAGARLEFSTPQRFFAAIAPMSAQLPLHEGELQHHAIGCYSVLREIKSNLARAEHVLDRVEALRETLSDHQRAELRSAWRDVCFNAFHDILAGSSIASAYVTARDQLGSAAHFGNELLVARLRQLRPELGTSAEQRIVLWNPGRHDFAGPVRYESWPEGRDLSPGKWQLLDEDGRVVPHQVVQSEAAVPSWLMTATVFDAQVPANGRRVLRLRQQASDVTPITTPPEPQLPARLELIEDTTDTWSHGVDRYAGRVLAAASFGPPRLVDAGAVLHAWVRHGIVGSSRVREERRIYAGAPGVELLYEVEWAERHAVMKLTWELPAPVKRYVPGVCGGLLERPADGRELPLQDYALVELADGSRLGFACPDIYAADVGERAIRFTLLRSPVFAHHEPMKLHDFARPTHTDRGLHTFRFRIVPETTEMALARMSMSYHRPPLIMEMTEGMPR